MVAGVRDALACGSSHRRRKARARGSGRALASPESKGFFCPRRLFTAKALAFSPPKGGCVPRVIPDSPRCLYSGTGHPPASVFEPVKHFSTVQCCVQLVIHGLDAMLSISYLRLALRFGDCLDLVRCCPSPS